MGHITRSLTISGSLSDHCAEQDDDDQDAWERLSRRVRQLAAEDEFSDLSLFVDEIG